MVAGFVVCELPQFVGDGLTCQRIGGWGYRTLRVAGVLTFRCAGVEKSVF